MELSNEIEVPQIQETEKREKKEKMSKTGTQASVNHLHVYSSYHVVGNPMSRLKYHHEVSTISH